jgi:hypothetical protein
MDPMDLLYYIPWWCSAASRLRGGHSRLGPQHPAQDQERLPARGHVGQSLKPTMTTEAMERVKLLTQENAQLRAEIGSMHDRLAVVERIVTDGGYSLGHEIERLRDQPTLPDKAKN